MKKKKSLRIRNRIELDARIKQLTAERESGSSALFASSDTTRAKAGDLQQYMQMAQVAIGLFRGLTNYHRSPKTRIRNAIISVSVLLLSSYVRSILVKQKKSDESS